jgi:uncharacterized membrane protein
MSSTTQKPDISKETREAKALRSKKPPGYLVEVTFVTLCLAFGKFYSLDAFSALSFVTILLPFMIYHILNLCGYILEFVTSLHMEADPTTDDDMQLLSGAQLTILVSMLQHLLGYFGLYSLAGPMNDLVDLKSKKNMFESLALGAAALQISLLIQIVSNFRMRKAIATAKGDVSSASFLGATGLTTIFNALTQTTTTLCSGG